MGPPSYMLFTCAHNIIDHTNILQVSNKCGISMRSLCRWEAGESKVYLSILAGAAVPKFKLGPLPWMILHYRVCPSPVQRENTDHMLVPGPYRPSDWEFYVLVVR